VRRSSGLRGFGDIINTYLSLKALKLLNESGGEELEGAVTYTLSLQNLDGGLLCWCYDLETKDGGKSSSRKDKS
jgi:prenyltransferase beta subunit